MKAYSISLIGALTLSVTPCYAQQQDIGTIVNNAVNSAFGSFFGGGELAVRDSVTRTETTISAVKNTLMLIDMLKQAIGGSGPSNLSTGELIAQQAQYGQDGSILYGQYSPELFTRTLKEDWVYTAGDWNDDETLRDHRRLTTQMDLMQLLKMRQDAFAGDAERLRQIKDSIDGCEGRNCQIQASGAAMAEAAWQLLQQQQLTMAVANAQAVAAAGELNDITQKRAQQRYVVTNGGQSPQLVEWVDRGLW